MRCLTFLSFLMMAVGSTGQVVDQQQLVYDFCSCWSSTLGQTFTPASTGMLTHLQLPATANGAVTLSFFQGEVNLGTFNPAQALYTHVFTPPSVCQNTLNWVDIQMSPGFPVVAGQIYSMAWGPDGRSIGYCCSNSNPYSRGRAFQVNFGYFDGSDWVFRIYQAGYPSPSPSPHSCQQTLNLNLAGYGINDGNQNLEDTADDCCALCKATAGCVGWSWISQTYIGYRPKGSCWLRSHIQGQYEEGGVISGKVVGECTNCAPLNEECRAEAIYYRDQRGFLSTDIANCFDPAGVATQLNNYGSSHTGTSYGCARSEIPNCNNIVCSAYVPFGAYSSLDILYCSLD